MKNLLIIQKDQFGYLTDSYKWCEYLRDKYHITLLCYDMGKPKIDLPNITIKYFDINGNRLTRGIKFIITCILYILKTNGIVIIEYFEKCHLLKRILPFKKMILDIRTLAVYKDKDRRQKYNNQLRKACHYFDLILAISTGVREQLKTDNQNIKILPLGSDTISTEQKNYEDLKLLYVGTFSNRNIDKTITGIELFHNKYPNIKLSYDIIGDGNGCELEELQNLTTNKKLDSIIHFHGRLPLTKTQQFFEKCNIGVSFIPMTDYFDKQPPTKTFEYILSGLFTIATMTSENKNLINTNNGILIKDTQSDFASAIYSIYKNRMNINESKIRESLSEYKWNKIVNNILHQILLEFYNG